MGQVLKITLGVVLGGLLLIVGCSALFAAGVEEEFSGGNTITTQDYAKAKTGTTTLADLRSEHGEPDSGDSNEFEFEEVEGVAEAENVSSDCVYYNREGGDFEFFQFCSDTGPNGTITSKSSW